MVDVVLGSLMGLLVGCIITLLCIWDVCGRGRLPAVAITLCFTLIGGFIGWCMAVEEANKYIAEYESVKQTIESSLENEILTGFERVELVKQAAECNKELAGRQYSASKWYGFQYDDRIFELEPVNLNSKGE